MMRVALILVCLANPALAAADAFDNRVRLAHQVETRPVGRVYQKRLLEETSREMGSAMWNCFPQNSPADTSYFTLVATIDRDRQPTRVEVRPSTPMSRCFAAEFMTLPFPELPRAYRKFGVPVVVEMAIHP